MTARMGAATPLADLTEHDWDRQLFETKRGLARVLGWTLVYHTLRSRGSRSGFPDRVIVRDRVIFAELKREGAKPTPDQVEWLTGLAEASAEVYLWRPSDLDEIAQVLGGRWQRTSTGLRAPDSYFQPGSLWLPSGHRADQHVQTTI